MPSDDPIILDPPQLQANPPKIGLTPTGIVPHWRQLWKEWTSGLWLLVGASPDIYTAAVAMGLLTAEGVPPSFAWGLRGLAFLGLAAKVINQKKREAV